jgi:hypothetical protein
MSQILFLPCRPGRRGRRWRQGRIVTSFAIGGGFVPTSLPRNSTSRHRDANPRIVPVIHGRRWEWHF